MKLSQEEKVAFDSIKALSRRDPKFLNDVFICLLQMVALEAYKKGETDDTNNLVFHIPYLCSIKTKFCDIIKYTADGKQKGVDIGIEMEANPSESLFDELRAISSGEEPPTKRYIKKKIIDKCSSILEIDGLEVEE